MNESQKPGDLLESQRFSNSNQPDKPDPVPGNNWVEKIQFAFNEVDVDHKGYITLDQWMNSRFGQIVTKEILTGEKLMEYFLQIDSDSDHIISWGELIDYLTVQQRLISADTFDRNLLLVNVAPDLETAHKFRKTTSCLRVIFVNFIEYIITLTESALIFWTLDCKPSSQFTDPDGFIDFCYLSCLSRVAIATKTRKIIFYDMKTKAKMPFSIKATIDNKDVNGLSLNDSKEKLARFKKQPRPPLFHIPTSMCSNPEEPYIYVGNQEGRIEIFHIFPSKKIKYAWDYERVKVKILHNAAVTYMTYIPSLSSFASSGDDGYIYIWQYEKNSKLFNISLSFKEPLNVPINFFVYDERSNSICYTMPYHCIGCWKLFSQQRVIRETPSQMTSTMALITISQESSFIITISTTNLISIFTPPNLELISNWFMNTHHHLVAPSGSIFINNHLFMIGNYISCWRCQTSDSDGMVPHQHPLLGALSNDIFGRVVTFDETGDIYSWNILNGNKVLSLSLAEKDAIVTSIKSDNFSRRLVIGYSNGKIKVVSINSGSLLRDTGKESLDGGCNSAIFATVLSNKYIVAASGRKEIIIFDDIPVKKMRYIKKLRGHTEHISNIYNLKDSFILSIGMGKEMFLWNHKSISPVCIYHIPNDPTAFIDIKQSKRLFAVGDSVGFLYILDIENPNPISTINVFKMNVKSPISALASSSNFSLIATGNREGYIKYLFINKIDVNNSSNEEQISFTEGNPFCAHLDVIETLSISEKYSVIISAGRDNEIRLWTIDPLRFVGVLGKHKKWILEDPNTFPEMPFHINEELFQVEEKKEPENPHKKLFHFDVRDSENSTEVVYSSVKNLDILEASNLVYNPITKPRFSYENVKSMQRELEEVCLIGRERPRIVDKLMRVKPSQTVIQGKKLMQFGDFVSNEEIENTQKMVGQLRSMSSHRKRKKSTD